MSVTAQLEGKFMLVEVSADVSKLQQAIIDLLDTILPVGQTLIPDGKNQIVLLINTADFEEKLGDLLQTIYRAVDDAHPSRADHILIRVKDHANRYENVFKICKT